MFAHFNIKIIMREFMIVEINPQFLNMSLTITIRWYYLNYYHGIVMSKINFFNLLSNNQNIWMDFTLKKVILIKCTNVYMTIKA